MDRFKRFTSVLAAVALIVFTGWQMPGSVSGSSAPQYADLNEIKNIVLYSPDEGWTVTAKIGSTLYGQCGPTHSGGACSITGLAAGTYTLYITRNGCTGSMNVYHPGSGITTVYWGPTNPDLDCAR